MAGEIIYDVPIFPLNTVLFPSMPLPLQVFEERYRAMVLDLCRGDRRFCVALIREGVEVGGDADPYTVACLAEAVHIQALPGGRYYIVAVGLERARILSTDRLSKPYLTGSLELWPEDGLDTTPDLVDRATHLFREYARIITEITGQKDTAVPLPAEPDLLSFVVATAFQSEPQVRQRLLEIPGCTERLTAEVELLQEELLILRAAAASQEPPSAGYGQFSAN